MHIKFRNTLIHIFKSIRKINLGRRVIGVSLVIGLVPLFVWSTIALHLGEHALQEQAIHYLEMRRDAKKQQLADYLRKIENDARALAKNPQLVDAVPVFEQTFDHFSREIRISNEQLVAMQEQVHTHYAMTDTLLQLRTELQLATAIEATSVPYQYLFHFDAPELRRSRFFQTHSQLHPWLAQAAELIGARDIKLISRELETVIYSVNKSADFANSLDAPHLQNSPLARLFEKQRVSAKTDTFFWSRTVQYPASANLATVFLAVPIFKENKWIGALICEFGFERIDTMLQTTEENSVGEQFFVLGKDYVPRTKVTKNGKEILFEQILSHPLTHRNFSKAVIYTQTAESGAFLENTKHGGQIITAYTSLTMFQEKCLLIASCPVTVMLTTLPQFQKMSYLILLSGSVIFICCALLMSRAILRPVRMLKQAMHNVVSDKKFSQHLETNHLDEFRDLTGVFNEMADQLDKQTSDLLHSQEQLEKEILERKFHEKALAYSEKFYRTILENAFDGVITFNIRGEITYASTKIQKILGYSAEELKQNNPILLVHPADRLIVKNTLGKLIKNRDLHNHLEVRILHQDKNWHEYEIFAVNLLRNPRVRGIICNFHDVTKQKEIEFALKQTRDEAEAANQAKSRFLANISHEIRTPLNAILGFLEILNREELTLQQRKYLEGVGSGSNSLLHIVNEILDLSKIDSGKMQLRYEITNITRMMHELAMMFKPQCEIKGLTFSLFIAPDTPVKLVLAANQLRQVLMNLLSNAIKFTHEGAISLMVIPRKRSQYAIDLHIEIEDTGIGIEGDQQEKIFNAFEQQSGQSLPLYGGTGLGLTISRRLVDMMNGSIYLDSMVQKGSRFVIELENIVVSQDAEPEEIHIEQERIHFQAAHILIADDIRLNRDVLAGLLADFPFTLHFAENGNDTLSIVKKENIDLIFLDRKMPDITGDEVARILKSDPRSAHVPIISVSALQENYTFDAVTTKPNFDGYIEKPVTLPKIIAQLRRFITQREYARENVQPVVQIMDAALSPFQNDAARDAFIVALEDDFIPRWQKVNSTRVIDEIEDFAEDVLVLAEKYDQDFFKDYGENLKLKAQQFDVELVHRLLSRFPGFIDQLTSIGTAVSPSLINEKSD